MQHLDSMVDKNRQTIYILLQFSLNCVEKRCLPTISLMFSLLLKLLRCISWYNIEVQLRWLTILKMWCAVERGNFQHFEIDFYSIGETFANFINVFPYMKRDMALNVRAFSLKEIIIYKVLKKITQNFRSVISGIVNCQMRCHGQGAYLCMQNY